MSFGIISSRMTIVSSKWLHYELKRPLQRSMSLISSSLKTPYSSYLLHDDDKNNSDKSTIHSSICTTLNRSVSTTSAYERGRNLSRAKRNKSDVINKEAVATTTSSLPFDSPHRITKPTLAIANTMPLSIEEMDNTSIVTLGSLGNHTARVEILKRHIMNIDQIGYDEACVKFNSISKKNDDIVLLLSLPYRIGIVTSLVAGFAAIPMVFDLPTAHWFNHHFVTTDIPEPQHLESSLEVGSWTWGWMEPPLGTISFVLLALQFARAQLENLGYKPYTSFVKTWRGKRLASQFPQYNAKVLINFSKSSALYVQR